jgi:surface protein
MSIDNSNLWKYVNLYCSGQKQSLPTSLQGLPIGQWDVSKVTDMHYLFSDKLSFNEPLNDWDVSNVTNMMSMFDNCRSFNQPLNKWNVSKVNNMNLMFYGCIAFDQDLSGWDVSSVSNYTKMFDKCPIQPSYKPDFNKKVAPVVSPIVDEETKDYEDGDGMSTLGQNQTFGESEEKPVGGKKKKRRKTRKTRRLKKKRRSKRRQ